MRRGRVRVRGRPAPKLAWRVEAERGIGREERIQRSTRRHDPIDAAHERAEALRLGDRWMEPGVERGRPGDREHGQDVDEPPPAPAPGRPVGDQPGDGAREREQHQHRSGPPRGLCEGGDTQRVHRSEPLPEQRARIEAEGQRDGERAEHDERGRVEAGAGAGDPYGRSLGGCRDDAGGDQQRDGRIDGQQVDAPLRCREREEDEPRAYPGLGETGDGRPRPPEGDDRKRQEGRPRQQSDQRERQEVAGAVLVARLRVRVEVPEPVLAGHGGDERRPFAAERHHVPAAGYQQGRPERRRGAQPARQAPVAAGKREHPRRQPRQHDGHRSLGEGADGCTRRGEHRPSATAATEREYPRRQHRGERGGERHVDARAGRRPRPLEAGGEDQCGRQSGRGPEGRARRGPGAEHRRGAERRRR